MRFLKVGTVVHLYVYQFAYLARFQTDLSGMSVFVL